MLVESVHGDFLNVVGFPLNHFCKKLAEIYYPPSKQSTHRVKHDSIPYVESFENLSDVEKECTSPSKTTDKKKAKRDCDPTSSSGPSLQHTTVLPNGVEEKPKRSVHLPSNIAELLDGFKASKVCAYTMVLCQQKGL